MKSIAETIKDKRIELGLSREKLAWEAKVTSKSIMSIENGALPSLRILSKVCDALDLEISVTEKNIKRFNDVELCFIIENIAEAALNGDKYASFSIDDDIDIDIKLEAEVKRHKEDDYMSGTGAWIVDDCRIKITYMNVADMQDRQIELPDFELLEVSAESKLRES